MFSFLNKNIPKQYSLASYLKGLFGSQTQKYFFKMARIVYPLIYTPNTQKPTGEKILIISEVGGLGDAILFRRVLEVIKKRYDIYLIIKGYHLPAYEDVVEKEKIFVATSTSHLFRIAKKISKEEFDILLLHGLSIISFFMTLIFFRKIRYKIGIFADQARGFLNKGFVPGDYPTVLDIYFDLAKYLGGEYKLYSFDKNKRNPIQKNKQILIHIGSGSLCKNWRIKNFIELFKLFDEAGITYKIIGSNQDLEVIKEFSNQLTVKPMATDSFAELIKLILDSQVVICHNTSILHLAFTLGTKTISFNSKGNYAWWNPYRNISPNEHFAFKASDKECGYSQQVKSLLLEKKQCGCSLFDSITPNAVFAVTQEMLSRSSGR